MTYYDLPVVKAPPWKWYVPAYFYAGGVAGAASVLHAFSDLPKLRWISVIGEAVGGVLLIADLGRPARFHHMMRTVNVRSPMNVGTWILSSAVFGSGVELVAPGKLRAARAISGGALATYTGVLIGNTAVPVWNATRERMPLLFAASSAASLAALLELLGPSPGREARTVKALAIGGKLAELAAVQATERAAGDGRVGAALRGNPLWRGAKYLMAASLGATVLGRPRLAGVLGTVSGVLLRFGILAAGKASAADPRATLEGTAVAVPDAMKQATPPIKEDLEKRVAPLAEVDPQPMTQVAGEGIDLEADKAAHAPRKLP